MWQIISTIVTSLDRFRFTSPLNENQKSIAQCLQLKYLGNIFQKIVEFSGNFSTQNLNINQNLCFVGSCPCLFLSQDFLWPSSTCMKMMLKKLLFYDKWRWHQGPPEEGSTCSSRAPAGLRAIIFRRARFTWKKDTKSQNNNWQMISKHIKGRLGPCVGWLVGVEMEK